MRWKCVGRAALRWRVLQMLCRSLGRPIRWPRESRPCIRRIWLRGIMQRHTAAVDLVRIYDDVIQTGRQLGVPMPRLLGLEPYVTAWQDQRPVQQANPGSMLTAF